MTNHKISVCILTYNRLEFLKKSISSVLDSNSNNFKLYVFNDNSNDGTKEYLEKLHFKKHLVAINHNKNLGLGLNSNYIIKFINSKYCLMLHDDDTIEPNYLGETLSLMEVDSEISMVGTGWHIIDANGEILKTLVYKEFNDNIILNDRDYFINHFKGLQFPWSGTLFRMEKIKKLRFNFDAHPIIADIIFLSTTAFNNKIGYIPKALMNYRNHPETTTNKCNYNLSFKEWESNFIFYESIVSKYKFDKNTRKSLNKANTKTLVWLLMISPNFKYFFKALTSKYFSFSCLEIKQLLTITKKFIKLILFLK